MALQKTVFTIHGFEAINAYHRVEEVKLKTKKDMIFYVRSYTLTEKPFFVEYAMSCEYELDGANIIKQAYEYLKTLPEFEGATDC